MNARKLPRAFFDTNVLVYADDLDNPAKQLTARKLWAEYRLAGKGVVSLQVLQEYFVNVTRKLGVEPQIARQKLELLTEFNMIVLSAADVLAAVDLHLLDKISLWDALIVRAASKSGCQILLSEDMQHGRVVDGVEIVNPFL
jgi:predicted nucleic acid-binding protein